MKLLVRERDGWRCTRCPTTNEDSVRRWGVSLDVHRLVPGSDYTVKGCVTLCRDCHPAVHAELPQKKRRGNTPLQSFRIPADVLNRLTRLAEDESRASGCQPNRTAVLIDLINREFTRRHPAG